MTSSDDPRGMPGFDMEALLRSAQQMGEQMMAAQAEASATVHEGHAGGGAVKVTVTGGLEFKSVSIDPSVVDPDDVEMLEDLVLAAIRDAIDQISGDVESSGLGGLDVGGLDIGALTGGMDLSALMGGLGGMPGGSMPGAIDIGGPEDDDDADDAEEGDDAGDGGGGR